MTPSTPPRRLRIASLAVVSLALAAGDARAQEPAGEPGAADRETARTLMVEGTTKLAAGDARAAYQAFQGAHTIMHVPSTGASVARAALALRLPLEAREACLEVGRMPAKPAEPPQFQAARSECQQLLTSAEAMMASLSIRLPPGAKGDVRVSVDGAPLLAAAMSVPRRVNPGAHVITARATGYRDWSLEVTVEPGATRSVTIELVPAASPAPVVAPAEATPSAPVTEPGKPPARGPSALVYAGFGVGAAGVLVGSVTGIVALSKASDAKKDCVDGVCPTDNKSAADSSKTMGTVSTVAFGVGLIGIGVGVYGLLADAPRESSRAAEGWRVSPAIGLGSLGLRGSFR